MPGDRRVITAMVLALAGVSLATPAAQASPPLKVDAGFFSMELSDIGRVTRLVDLRTGADYVAADKPVPLVSVVADGQQAAPTKMEYSPQDKVHVPTRRRSR